MDRRGQEKGTALLIERKPSAYLADSLPYVYREKSNPVLEETTIEVRSFERWVVEWVEHDYHRKGDRSAVEVHYFVKTTTQHPSYSEPIYLDHQTTGKYIFTEDEGVLSIGGEYQDYAFEALKVAQKKFRGEIIVWTHHPIQVRQQFEIYNVGRVMEFLSVDSTYEEAVINYIYEHEPKDFMVISGDSSVKGIPNTLQCGPDGLIQKQK